MQAKKHWFQNGLRFSCQPGCVRCCCGAPGDVFITDEELRSLAAHLDIPFEEFDNQYVRHYSSGRKSLLERANGDCVLLAGSGCSVYAVRPQQCRAYPFWPEILRRRATWLREARRCPGVNAGALHGPEAILAALKSQAQAGA